MGSVARILMSLRAVVLAVSLACAAPLRASDTQELITWLLQDGRSVKDVPFAEVLAATTGKKILPIDPVADKAWLTTLAGALDRTLARLNDSSEQIRNAGRISEASRFIEDELRAELNQQPGWNCTIPSVASGEEQRSGYPDMRLVLPDGSIVFLDPKLFAADSRTSTLRTFYYEPKTLTNKVHDDARHLLVGIPHNGKSGADLRLLGWELVDVSQLRVQLKAEFQASNKDIYREDATVARSRAP